MRAQFVLSEMWIGLRRNLTMTLAVIITVAISTALLGVAVMVRTGVDQVEYNTLNQVEVSVFLKDTISSGELDAVHQQLTAMPQVKSVQYISKADACKRFKSESPSLAKVAGCDAIPQSFVVHLKNPRQFNVVSSALTGTPGVDTVTNANNELKELFSFLNRLSTGAFVFAIFLLIAALLLIYNAIRVAAFSRRRETGIMRLVGASNTFIRLPFILESVIAGLIGTLIGVVAVRLVQSVILGRIATGLLRPFANLGHFYGALPWMFGVGIVLAALAAFVTLQRHLRV